MAIDGSTTISCRKAVRLIIARQFTVEHFQREIDLKSGRLLHTPRRSVHRGLTCTPISVDRKKGKIERTPPFFGGRNHIVSLVGGFNHLEI